MRMEAWTKTSFDHTIAWVTGVIEDAVCSALKVNPPAARGAAGGHFHPSIWLPSGRLPNPRQLMTFPPRIFLLV
jgi:hypothetical protein